jgi:hypothetical protein
MAKARVAISTDGAGSSGAAGRPLGQNIGGKAYQGPAPASMYTRSSIKKPNTNLTNRYGITNQTANTNSAVTGPTSGVSQSLPDNQAVLQRKAPRQVC